MGEIRRWFWSWVFLLVAGCTTSHSHPNTTTLSLNPQLGNLSQSLISHRAPGANRQGKGVVSPFLTWPVKGPILSQFGDVRGDVRNKGIDIQAPAGSPIRAAGDGKVSFTNNEVKGFGRVIIVNHENGFQTVYTHNAENLVTLGQTVRKRETIGRVGATGRAETSYLHFEVRRNHRPVNPVLYLSMWDEM